jgi:phage terminase large subunit-like protein
MTRSRRSSRNKPDRPDAVDGYSFNPSRPARVCEFIETFCTMSKGQLWAGEPMKLMEWQRRDIIDPLFGWVDENDRRRYRTAAIFTPKKV